MRRVSGYCGLVLIAALGLFAGDVPDEQRRIFEAQEAQRQRDLESEVTARYVPGAVVCDACKNGDFELGLEGWSGAYGNVAYGADEPVLTNLTAGISQGPIDRSHARHTVVSGDDGLDPFTGITQVAPGGSTRAVRIGNAFYGGGVELLERTFVVPRDKPFLGFRYAVVLEDPHHKPATHQPLFRVRVLDAEKMEISGLVDLIPGDERLDRLIAGDGNFTELIRPRPMVPIDYRPWTCASIDLSAYVDQTVTVQFITEDCSELGHWGYAYVDDFCDADCAISVTPSCGSGPNLVLNGDFESSNPGFDSDFIYEPAPVAARAVLPGEYAIVDELQARIVSPTWVVKSHELCDSTGKFLAVNGDTGKSRSRLVWSPTISVAPGTAYRFCVWLRNLAQCALDVKPKIELRFSSPPDSRVPSVIDADRCLACDWKRESRRIVIPTDISTLTAEIWLDESAGGDGNDLAIDDISLRVEAAEVIP